MNNTVTVLWAIAKIITSGNKIKCFISKIFIKAWRGKILFKFWFCFCSFQTDEKLKQNLKSFKNYNHIELEIPEKFKTVLNKETDKKEKLPRNILKHLLQNKSMQLHLIVVYDFETMIL